MQSPEHGGGEKKLADSPFERLICAVADRLKKTPEEIRDMDAADLMEMAAWIEERTIAERQWQARLAARICAAIQKFMVGGQWDEEAFMPRTQDKDSAEELKQQIIAAIMGASRRSKGK